MYMYILCMQSQTWVQVLVHVLQNVPQYMYIQSPVQHEVFMYMYI